MKKFLTILMIATLLPFAAEAKKHKHPEGGEYPLRWSDGSGRSECQHLQKGQGKGRESFSAGHRQFSVVAAREG